MKNVKISYVLTTFNKIESLRVVLNDVLKNIDYQFEELIVIDGGSRDGTYEYLKNLYDINKIDLFISEIDKGEAHGFNKGILLAKGEFIKIITDDDIFNLDIVRSSVNFLKCNDGIDFLFSNGYTFDLINGKHNYHLHNYSEDFKNWKNNTAAFSFCGLGLLLRKSSLPLIGLFNTNYIRVDAEYSFRNSSNGSSIAFLATPSWVRVANSLSNSVKFKSRMVQEEVIFNKLYLNKNSSLLKYKHMFKNIIRLFFKSKVVKSDNFNYNLVYNNSSKLLCETNLEFYK